jgi:hypothetical protein
MKKQWERPWPQDPESEGYVKVTQDNKKDLIRVGAILYCAPVSGKTLPAVNVYFIYPHMNSRGSLHIYGAPSMAGGTYDFSVYVDEIQTRESYEEFFKLCIKEMIDAGRLYVNSNDERVRFKYDKK